MDDPHTTVNQHTPLVERAKRAHAFLFVEGGTMNRKKLSALLECTPIDLTEALDALSKYLEGSGIALVVSDTEASLVVSGETGDAVQSALKHELDRDIGDAGLEVLATVMYLGPSTRARIDYIRGVNSASTLRTLLARGLIERTGNPEDAREYLYRPTAEALAHLGATQKENLPDYDRIVAELAAFERKNDPFEKTEKSNDSDDTG